MAPTPALTTAGGRLSNGAGVQNNAGMSSDPADYMRTERLLALGSVITASGAMEDLLRDAFCALVGSKFAAVVAGGQGADWLIGYCKDLIDAHMELPEASRESVKAALQLCRSANERRNQLVHGAKTASGQPDGAFQVLKSRRHQYKLHVEQWTPAQIDDVVHALVHAYQELLTAMLHAVGPDIAVLSDQLEWEEP
jgi:hypothetical protein